MGYDDTCDILCVHVLYAREGNQSNMYCSLSLGYSSTVHPSVRPLTQPINPPHQDPLHISKKKEEMLELEGREQAGPDLRFFDRMFSQH